MLRSFLQQRKCFFVSAGVSLCVGIFLWFYSTVPPYGSLSNELSNHSWGILVDIAHKWRKFDFSFWDRGIGAGTCLFSSGFYPILNPTNVIALFVSDEVFFKFKIIEPYVAGVFLATFVLLRIFSVRVPYAVFGGLLYMGLGFGRFATVADAPYFLWGCALFPAIVYVLERFEDKQWMLTASAAGLVLSLQFFVEGAPQFLQIFIWVFIFLVLRGSGLLDKKGPRSLSAFRWGGGCFLFCFFALGLCAVQLLPTFNFSFFDSVRVISSQYSINNFPIFDRSVNESKGSIFTFLQRIIVNPGGVSWRAVMALWLLAIGFIVTNGRALMESFGRKRVLGALYFATVLYFLVPTAAGWLVEILPVFEKILSPLSLVTFAYSVHIIDFFAILMLVMILDYGTRMTAKRSIKQNILWAIIGMVAVFFVIFPILMTNLLFRDFVLVFFPAADNFIPASINSAISVCLLGAILIFYYIFNPSWRWVAYVAWGALMLLGFMTMVLSFNWNNKGQQTDIYDYAMDSPEVKYYHGASGKYYLPVDGIYALSHNLNLLYGVDGTSGFLQVPPKRFNQFMASYHTDRMQKLKSWWVPKYNIINPQGALATRFPVDFTTISKDRILGWPGFIKKVNGKNLDVWERQGQTQRVYFADTRVVVEYDRVIALFDEPFGHVIHVVKNDADTFGIKDKKLAPAEKNRYCYFDFKQRRGDELMFKVRTVTEVFVVVPEIFQSGWRVFVDGRNIKIFPADHLFIGFEIPPGQHDIIMKFRPPYFYLGLFINICCVGLFLFVFLYQRKIS